MISPNLENGQKITLRFLYSITEVDPKRQDLNYRIIASLPDGHKEACLINDFTWIPQIMADFAKEYEAAEKRNFFPKMPKPTWRITLIHPSEYESMVVDGKLEKSERLPAGTRSSWSWRTGGFPQLFIGRSERIEVKSKEASVVFLLPRGGYERALVEAMGRFFIHAYTFYVKLFGPLAGNEIHIAASSAGMGGHGAMLGVFLDATAFQEKRPEGELSESNFFDEVAAHELAHSWWGISVSSYGRGTKFLREAFCNFATFHLAREAFGLDKFAENRAILFYRGLAKNRLFNPTSDNANLAYTKGALVLELLREEMGNEIFFRILSAFASRYKDSFVTFTDFLSFCNEISQRDWMPFFDQWCYGEGYPIYKLVSFTSNPEKGAWKTSVTIRNEGKGIVPCPLVLKMGSQAQADFFRLPGGEEKTFVYETPHQVDLVTIDPDHTAYQGDTEEGRLKVLAVKETDSGWLNYWKGIVSWDIGKKEESAGLVSKAIDIFVRALGPGKGHPAFYLSRGLIYFRSSQVQKANEDLRTFMDRVLEVVSERADKLDGLKGTLAYAGILSENPQERQDKFRQILKAITGEDIPLDPNLDGLRRWWETHRSTFEAGPGALNLAPGGIK